MKTENVKASTKTIFIHLCNVMNKLDNNELSIESAKAQSDLAKQANNILRYELDKAIAKAKFQEKIDILEIEQK